MRKPLTAQPSLRNNRRILTTWRISKLNHRAWDALRVLKTATKMRQLSWLVILELLFLGWRCAEGQQCQKFNIGLNDRSKISDDQFTASSFLSPETAPFHARIGDTEGEGWCAQESRNNEYLQVDLRRDYVVCGVIVQGGIHGNVDSFDLEFSTDGSFFSPYSKTLVRVNQQEEEAEFHPLGPYPVGRYVRLYPRKIRNFLCARLDLYGFPGPKVTCTPQYIIAEFKKAHYPGLEAEGMHLKNTSCLADDENATHILFNIPLRNCGTERILLNDSYIQYSNEIIRRITGVGISYKMDMFFPINCKYDRRETVGDIRIELPATTTEAPTSDATTLKPLQRKISFIGWLVTLWISVSGLLTLWY